MASKKHLDFIVAGAAKCATTWIYESLKEHPDIYMPETDNIDYFSCKYHKGEEYYRGYFDGANDKDLIGEESPWYIISQEAPERIKNDLDEPKIIFAVRNPVDRAFSQWWHGYSRGLTDDNFDELFSSYSRYINWIYPGFYYKHLQRYLKHFDESQIKIVFMDDLKDDDEKFIQEIYDFIGADSGYIPSTASSKVNNASDDKTKIYGKTKELARQNLPLFMKKSLRPIRRNMDEFLANKTKYEEGMDSEIRKELESLYREDVKKLSEYAERDLSHWFEYEKF